MKKIGKFALAAGLFSACLSVTFACTDFRLTAEDGTVMISRSMEFAADLKSNLMTSPRGRVINNIAPNGKTGLSWKNKYGYVFLDGYNLGIPIDGMNEYGLAIELLYLPNEAQFQTVPDGQEAHALSYLHFGDWVLGNFKSIVEIKRALPSVFVFAQPLPEVNNMIFPVHFVITDNTGRSIVVEYVGGKLNIYDNELGVATNSPTYDWHITNLRNYLNLTPSNPKPVIDHGITFVSTGQGSGMIGLPGDISPPSRFIKMSVMTKTVIQPKNADDALNIGQHIINNVDIPLGFVRTAINANTSTNELTQWVVFKDLTHNMFYYRTYQNLTIRSVDLSKVNFTANAPQLKMPIADSAYIVDMTSQFLASANAATPPAKVPAAN